MEGRRKFIARRRGRTKRWAWLSGKEAVAPGGVVVLSLCSALSGGGLVVCDGGGKILYR